MIKKRHLVHIGQVTAALALSAVFVFVWVVVYAGMGQAIAAAGRAFRQVYFGN